MKGLGRWTGVAVLVAVALLLPGKTDYRGVPALEPVGGARRRGPHGPRGHGTRGRALAGHDCRDCPKARSGSSPDSPVTILVAGRIARFRQKRPLDRRDRPRGAGARCSRLPKESKKLDGEPLQRAPSFLARSRKEIHRFLSNRWRLLLASSLPPPMEWLARDIRRTANGGGQLEHPGKGRAGGGPAPIDIARNDIGSVSRDNEPSPPRSLLA